MNEATHPKNFWGRACNRLEKYCHGNFGSAKILVWGTKIPGKFGPPDYYFQKILVRAWNNDPSAKTSV